MARERLGSNADAGEGLEEGNWSVSCGVAVAALVVVGEGWLYRGGVA